MIRSLFFQSFGKFTQKQFDLADVTVILGENEAGKTTFFDGLFQALCNPSETKKAGKLLKGRYGQGRSVSLTYTNLIGGMSIPEDAFLNLFAIRAGDLNMDWNPGNDWVEKLKSQLFHGGIDPKVLAEEFEKRSSDKKNFVHNKEIEAARLKKEAAKIQLEKFNRERQALFEKEKILRSLESSLLQVQNQAASLNVQIEKCEKALAFEERILQRQRLESQIAKIHDLEKLQSEAQRLQIFSLNSREEWEILSRDYQKSLEVLNNAKNKCEFHNESILNTKTDSQKLNSELQNSEIEVEALKSMLEPINGAFQKKGNTLWPLLLGFFLALVFIVIGILCFLYLKNPTSIIALLGFIALAFGSVMLGFWSKKFARTKKISLEITRLKEGWKQSRHRQAIEAMQTLEEFILLSMQQMQSENEVLKRQSSAMNDKLAELEKRSGELANVANQLEIETSEKKQQEKKYLESLGVQSGEELLLKISQVDSLRTQIENVEAEVQKISSYSNISNLSNQLSPVELMRDLNRKLNQMDDEGIPSQGLDEASLQRLKVEYKEFKIHKESLSQKERIQVAETSQLSGEVGNSLGKIAGEIVAAEDSLKQYHLEIENKDAEKKAAAMAGEIFKTMGDGARYLWSTLAVEIEKILSAIMPTARSLQLNGLSTDQLQYQDSLGAIRALEHLSTGTRDLVVLAARLALAMISRTEPAILVLDEPFLSLDQNRETGAINLLKNFQAQTGWQIVLLTKERQLLEKMQLAFPKLGVITLSANYATKLD